MGSQRAYGALETPGSSFRHRRIQPRRREGPELSISAPNGRLCARATPYNFVPLPHQSLAKGTDERIPEILGDSLISVSGPLSARAKVLISLSEAPLGLVSAPSKERRVRYLSRVFFVQHRIVVFCRDTLAHPWATLPGRRWYRLGMVSRGEKQVG